jgi:hypothetical protein
MLSINGRFANLQWRGVQSFWHDSSFEETQIRFLPSGSEMGFVPVGIHRDAQRNSMGMTRFWGRRKLYPWIHPPTYE